MAKVKLVAWDVYGTIIASVYKNSRTNDLQLRPGALEALTQIRTKGIEQITCSDGNLENLKDNFKEVGIEWREFFEDLYLMTWGRPKDFSYILATHGLKPSQLLIIGNNYELDIRLANQQRCKTIYIPEKYKNKPTPINVQEIIKKLTHPINPRRTR